MSREEEREEKQANPLTVVLITHLAEDILRDVETTVSFLQALSSKAASPKIECALQDYQEFLNEIRPVCKRGFQTQEEVQKFWHKMQKIIKKHENVSPPPEKPDPERHPFLAHVVAWETAIAKGQEGIYDLLCDEYQIPQEYRRNLDSEQQKEIDKLKK